MSSKMLRMEGKNIAMIDKKKSQLNEGHILKLKLKLEALPICIYHSFICKTREAGDSLASPESITRVPKTYITLECCHIFSHFYQFLNKECSYARY